MRHLDAPGATNGYSLSRCTTTFGQIMAWDEYSALFAEGNREFVLELRHVGGGVLLQASCDKFHLGTIYVVLHNRIGVHIALLV